MIYFSAKTKGFYPTNIVSKERYENNNSWPDDTVEVSVSDFEKYISTPPIGMMLGSKNGSPAWVNESQSEKGVLVKIAEIKKQQLMNEADKKISPLERSVRLNMANDTEKAQLEAWERYSVLLNRVNTDDAPEILWPESPY